MAEGGTECVFGCLKKNGGVEGGAAPPAGGVGGGRSPPPCISKKPLKPPSRRFKRAERGLSAFWV